MENVEIKGVDMEKYKELLQRLKNNKDNVPVEMLRSKYKKAYGELVQRLHNMTLEIAREMALGGLKVRREDAVDTYAKINAAIEESGLLESISHDVYHDQDFDMVLSHMAELRSVVFRVVAGGETR